MKTRILAILAIAAAIGCDPYAKTNNGPPQIIGADAADVTNGNPPLAVFDSSIGTSGAWVLGKVPYTGSYATHADWVTDTTRTDRPVNGTKQPVIFVFLNKSMDGATVQTTVGDCTPTNGWLNVVDNSGATCTGGGAPTWYSCYDPSSPSPDQGASIVFYRSCTPTSETWADADPLEQGQTYTLSGTIKDRSGNDLAIDVVVNTAPVPPEPPKTP